MGQRSELTGIERELVLNYLVDANVPVTVFPAGVERVFKTEKAAPEAAVFPVALPAEQIHIFDQRIILLKNPSLNVLSFAEKEVRVEFYFNRMGLYFVTKLRKIQTGIALVIPDTIYHIRDESPEGRESGFSAVLYFSCSNKIQVHFECVQKTGYQLFEKPKWSDISPDKQPKAKYYLEKIVADCGRNAMGNGLQLIPVCRFLTETLTVVSAVQGRADPFSVIYIDDRHIVFASENGNMQLQESVEYALELSFALPVQAVPPRQIYVTCVAENIYKSENSDGVCAICRFTSIKEEDRRFLYEKTMKHLYE